MNVPKSIFRQYDVRGLVDRELTPEFARALGRAFASVAHERLGRPAVVAVGRDNRPSGDALSRGVRRGITEAGGTAIDVGTLPTPALYFAVSALRTDAGLQVTGSHNPPEFNGFKMVLAGDAFHGDDILGLWEIIMAERWRSGPGKESSDGSVLQRYREGIISRHKLKRPVTVVVDCGNGVGSLISVSTLQGLGAEVTPLFCESDGSFPNHHPDPTVPENLRDLQAAVRRTGAELGIAFDGDADRIGAVDETGEIIYGDQLLVIFGRDAVERFGPGTPVIFDVKCSEVLPAALTAAGARPVMWKTGHSLIKAKMKELKAPLAGEMSGHMFFGGDYLGFDDALFASGTAARDCEPPALWTGHPSGGPAAYLRHSRDPGGMRRGGKIRPGRAGCGLFRIPLPGEYHRRGANHVSQGLGAAAGVEHRAGACHALRSHRRRVPRRLPSRSRGVSGKSEKRKR